MNKFLILLVAALFSLQACNTSKPTPAGPATVVIPEAPADDPDSVAEDMSYDEGRDEDFNDINVPDDIQMPDTLPVYRATETTYFDLIDTKLWVSFDWTKRHCIGTAEITAAPVAKARRILDLDAVGFDIRSVSNSEGKKLTYKYDNKVLSVDLGMDYAVGKAAKVRIEYVAKPDELKAGGSAAITSDKGLYFINPDGKDKNKPRQIWTQGETQSNSKWFPTIDKPNQRCTQEMWITVEDNFKTLSNGVLVDSRKNKDGTRTDHYKMSQPHAPYLFMMAIGEFAIVNDKWNNVPLKYYVEPKYEKDAKAIYNHTPEMLSFFSERLGVKYPWPTFSQVIVRDYVSGAMENTTAVIFGEFCQKTTRELLDGDNDAIVAHEMFHHWFGDYVTCESWSNLTLNEGFANYSEYLWEEHKNGRDAADYHRMNEMAGYLAASRGGMHDLINYSYDSREDMFDAHSYNKGGLVLHMLRSYLGDDVFFRGLNLYLTKNAYTAVEAAQLRLAMEEVSGEDLNWFFNQWYFGSGQPELTVRDSMDASGKKLYLTVTQTQSGPQQQHIFQLPVNVDIYAGGETPPERKQIFVNRRTQTFAFDVDKAPANVIFDADNVLLAKIKHDKSREAYKYQATHNKTLYDRMVALDKIKSELTPEVDAIILGYLSDKSPVIRRKALEQVDLTAYPSFEPKVIQLATEDKDPAVRSTALDLLAENPKPEYEAVFIKNINDEVAYSVLGSALTGLNKMNKEKAAPYVTRYENEDNSFITNAVSGIYMANGDPKALTLLAGKLGEVEGFEAFGLFGTYTELLLSSDKNTIREGFDSIENMAKNESFSQWKKFAIAKALYDIAGAVQSNKDFTEAEASSMVSRSNTIVQSFIDNESNEQLKNAMSNMLIKT